MAKLLLLFHLTVAVIYNIGNVELISDNVHLFPGQSTPMKKGNLVLALPVLKKQYDISFQVYPTKWTKKGQWGSVLHLTISSNMDKYGDRIPGVWFSPNPVGNENSIVPANAVSGNLNDHVYSPRVSLNKWSKMRLTQIVDTSGNYIYRVTLNGKQIVEKVNTKPMEFRNVKVYVGDPWYPAQPGNIKDVTIKNIDEALHLFPGQSTPMKKGNLVLALPVLKKQYDISFQVYPTKWTKKGQWGSVLHLTISSNIDKYGARIPGVWFSPNPVGNGNSIVPANAVSGDLNYHVYSPRVTLNKWSKMRLTQTVDTSGNYIYRVTLDGEQIVEKVNTKPMEFRNVKVYVGDPWYPAQPGNIKDVIIKNIG